MSLKNLKFKVNKIILIGSAGIVHKKNLLIRLKIKMFKVFKKNLSTPLLKKIFPNLLTKLKNAFGSEDYKNASPIMKETLVKLVNTDLKDYLQNIKVSTLLIWGEKDTETPIEDGKLMQQTIPDCGLVTIKNCSHYVYLEEPQYINRIIKYFLNGENK